MTNAVRSLKAKAASFMMAMVMLFGVLVIAAPQASAATTPEYFFRYNETTGTYTPLAMGHATVNHAVDNGDGTITLYMQEMSIATLRGYVSSFELADVDGNVISDNLVTISQEYQDYLDAFDGDESEYLAYLNAYVGITHTITYEGSAGDYVRVILNMDIRNTQTGDIFQHPTIDCFVKI